MSEKAEEALFGWVHVSDIHFGHGDASHGWDQRLVLAELRRDIKAISATTRVDALFVTGDIAFSGGGRSADEYERAREWLLEAGKAAGVGPDRIFLVPGNHDVNRAVDDRDPATGDLVKALRDRSPPGKSIDEALKKDDQRRLLAGRMGAYLDLARGFGPWAGSATVPPAEDRLFWVHRLQLDRMKARIVGLNTSLLCKDDQDKGRLQLGAMQIARALEEDAAPDELIVALSHHPLRKGWLADEDRADAFLRNHAHVHLSGHVHEQDSEEARSGTGGSFVRITAGAAHGDQLPAWIPATHGYNLGEVRRSAEGKALLRIYPRLWSRAHAAFVLDVNCVPKDATSSDHGLRLALPPLPAPARSPAAGPVRVFFSYAPEDEPYRKELEKHLGMLMKRERLIEGYSSRSTAGQDWRGAVDADLARAQIIVLLLSNDYVFSDYCYDVEMEAARGRYEAGEARVIPVLVRALDLARREELKRAPLWFERLQRVPRGSGQELVDGKPVESWPSQSAAWTEVAGEIRAEVNKIRARGGGPA